MSQGNGDGGQRTTAESFEIKVGLAEMLKGGVIMDVTSPDQAKPCASDGLALRGVRLVAILYPFSLRSA